MSRKPTDPATHKSVNITVPMTADQKAVIVKAAAMHGLDPSTWVRMVAYRAAREFFLEHDVQGMSDVERDSNGKPLTQADWDNYDNASTVMGE